MIKRILIAETEKSVLEMIQNYLVNKDFQVVLSADGKDALDKIEMQLFDLYLIKVKLPGLCGTELLMKIKEIQPAAVVILITDADSVDIAAQALQKGAFQYLTIPFELGELAQAIDSGLKRSEESDEVGGISPASLEISKELIDLLLLKGFTSEQQKAFQQMGDLIQYNTNDKITLNDQSGTMIWVENGRVSVMINGSQVDTLRPGDLWGEETFISSNSIFTELVVQAPSQIRHFKRQKLLEFFAYQDESLIKRFMINLIQCMYFKWRKAIVKLGTTTGFSNYNPNL